MDLKLEQGKGQTEVFQKYLTWEAGRPFLSDSVRRRASSVLVVPTTLTLALKTIAWTQFQLRDPPHDLTAQSYAVVELPNVDVRSQLTPAGSTQDCCDSNAKNIRCSSRTDPEQKS